MTNRIQVPDCRPNGPRRDWSTDTGLVHSGGHPVSPLISFFQQVGRVDGLGIALHLQEYIPHPLTPFPQAVRSVQQQLRHMRRFITIVVGYQLGVKGLVNPLPPCPPRGPSGGVLLRFSQRASRSSNKNSSVACVVSRLGDAVKNSPFRLGGTANKAFFYQGRD